MTQPTESPMMTSQENPMLTEEELAYDICEACNGTGIEEGREWDGYRCAVCKGRKIVPVIELEHIPTAGDFL